KREQSNNYKRIERFSGSFMRRFTLPEAANLEKIKAKTTDGVLELTVPKKAKAQAKPLEIKVEK
ncbi:MAG TPA: heat-shock protein Hsp20, partial [Methylophaga sp.]|nr:heat-shock protein Hsp20 [Methylophaga sp.]